jgi:sulfur-oxidizing protein SoxZ
VTAQGRQEPGAATRIRATVNDGATEVRMQMSHPMENGLRKGPSGDRVPAHYITEVSIRHNDRVVLAASFGPSVSTNPYLAFSFAGGAPGDEITVEWRDSSGDTRSDTHRIG